MFVHYNRTDACCDFYRWRSITSLSMSTAPMMSWSWLQMDSGTCCPIRKWQRRYLVSLETVTLMTSTGRFLSVGWASTIYSCNPEDHDGLFWVQENVILLLIRDGEVGNKGGFLSEEPFLVPQTFHWSVLKRTICFLVWRTF